MIMEGSEQLRLQLSTSQEQTVVQAPPEARCARRRTLILYVSHRRPSEELLEPLLEINAELPFDDVHFIFMNDQSVSHDGS